MANQIPEFLINYRVYENGSNVIGVGDVTLPSIEAMTETIGGAGIAGEVESVILGHFKSMTISIKWKTIGISAFSLSEQRTHQLDFRGSMQVYDAGSGAISTVAVKVSTKLMPKKTSLGNFQVAKTTDGENEMEVMYLNVYIKGESVCEIDKLNFICKINGTDYLNSVRADIGM